jgi:hypothetical protein
VGFCAAVYVLWFDYSGGHVGAGGSDFDQLWFAARHAWNHQNPYPLIGPGKAFDWRWPFVYPLTTAIAVLPIAWLPLLPARMIFAGVSAGTLTFALLRQGTAVLPVLASAAVLDAVRAAQISPLLTAGVVLTGAAVALSFKPHIGLLLLVASPRPRAMAVAALSTVLCIAIAFWFVPTWPSSWLEALQDTGHFRAPVLVLGGPLLLLAAVRWRRLDARVLLACALVPHTPAIYDVVPLALLARGFRESMAFALLTYIALFAQVQLVTGLPPADASTMAARILNLTIYLPALLAVLLRPNEGVDEDDGVLSRWTARARRVDVAPEHSLSAAP